MRRSEGPKAAPKSVTFGPFEVNLETEELRRKGHPIRLPAQSFQVLRLLLSRPGELVTRPELQRALWPNDSFGDFEHGLNAAVNRLREALGDSADTPRFVETLPRRGYRFIATLDPQPAPHPSRRPDLPPQPAVLAANPLAQLTTPEPRPPHHIPRLPLLLAIAAIALTGLLLALWHRRTTTSRTSAQNTNPTYDDSAVQVTPLTTLPGTEYGPTFSPDGSQVVFAWDGGNPDKTNPYDLYVKVVGSERIQQLTHRPTEWIIPAWSPDGRNIAFTRKGPNMTGVFVISALGGPERKLAQAPVFYSPPMSLSWFPDGQRLVFGGDDGMRVVSLADGSVRSIRNTPDCSPSIAPALSPDGHWLAFACTNDMSYELEIMPANGGPVQKLIRVNDIPSPLAWTADSTRILYTEIGRLFAISREGGPPQLLTFAHTALTPTVALHGGRLAWAETTANVNLWRMDLRPGRQGATSLLSATSGMQRAPDISPDGKELAFESERSGSHDVWVSNLDGGDAIQMGQFRTLTGSPRWSPDGRQIVFDSRESGPASLYLVDPQQGLPRRLDTGDMAASVPRWSKDGTWIYFNGFSGLHSSGIFKVPARGGTPHLVTSSPAYNAQEDHAGRTLYFFVGDNNGPIHVLDLTTGKESALAGMPAVDTPTDWVLASNGIYFIDPAAKPPTITFYDFATHRVTKRMPLPKPPNFWGGLALAPDESWLAYAQVDRNDSDLMLAEPFH